MCCNMASPPSPSTKKLKLDEAAAVLLKEGNIITLKSEVWKKLDEEDTQIESSLPNYLATVYGNLSHVTDHSPLLFNSPSFHGNTLVPLSETVAKQPEYVPPPDCLSLVDCRVIGQLVSLLAIVTQVNPPREINTRNGEKVVMASVLLSDPTLFQFKLTLWRETAQWVERLTLGDILLLSSRRALVATATSDYICCVDVRVKEWEGEKVAHTVMLTRLLNLHQPKRIPLKIRDKIPQHIYSNFYSWAIRDHFFLFDRQSREDKYNIIEFKKSDELFSESLVHFRGKLVKIIANKMLLMSDCPALSVIINLVGHQSQLWFSRLIKGVGLVWDAAYLLVLPEGSQGGYTVLQSTSRSYFKSSDQSKAKEVLENLSSNPVLNDTRTVSVSQLNEIQSSGVYHVKARATSMRFVMGESCDGFNLCSIKEKNELDYYQMFILLESCLYIGCSFCSEPLVQDTNGVYCLCPQCSSKSPDVSCVHYYRPLCVTLTDSSPCITSSLCTGSSFCTPTIFHTVTIPSITVNELLSDVCPPDTIKDILSLPHHNDKVGSVGVALCGRVSDLMLEREWVVCIDALCDTNSYLLSLKTTVLTVCV